MPTRHIEENSSMSDEEEVLSSNHDEQLLMGGEKQWPPSELETRPKKNSFMLTIERYRWLIDTFLLFVIVGLLLLLRGQSKEHLPSSRQVGGDSTGASPEFSTQIMKFESDMSFAPKNMSHFFTDETLATWNNLMPVGTGRPLNTEYFSATSMTHQLHCLYMMARIYSGISSNMTLALPDDPDTHFLHCVDYLRQGIMCSADLALEVHDAMDPDDLGPLDGSWSGIHVCKDYNQVKSYLEEQIVEGVRVVLPIDD